MTYQLPEPTPCGYIAGTEYFYTAEQMQQAYAAGREARPVCLWNNVDGCWETTCGNAFEINDGTPAGNHMAYCCYCGGKVEEEIK